MLMELLLVFGMVPREPAFAVVGPILNEVFARQVWSEGMVPLWDMSGCYGPSAAALAAISWRPSILLRYTRTDDTPRPLREGVTRAVAVLRRLGPVGDGPWLPHAFRAEESDPLSVERFREFQRRGPAEWIADLEELRSELLRLADAREQEPLPRLQAEYDFLLAVTTRRLAFLLEYSAALGRLAKGRLPPLDTIPGAKGWKLVPTPKAGAGREVKLLIEESDRLFDRLTRTHPGTPWAYLATIIRPRPVGLRWEPYTFGESR